MTRPLHRLSTTAIRNAKLPPGKRTRRLADGGCLYLEIKRLRNGEESRAWIFRFGTGHKVCSRTGKPRLVERFMGLGPLHDLSLADARQRAAALRLKRLDGVDPLAERRAAREAETVNTAKAMTFQQCAKAYITAQQSGWKSAKHGKQWTRTLETYVYKTFGHLPIGAVDVGLVTKVLEPIWSRKPETAGRVRGRIEAILDWATARGYRKGENPARWRGHLDKLLPARSKVRAVKHHAALPYDEIGEFMVELKARPALAARALEFAILTAARTGEAIGARWEEIDLQAKTWTVPGERMKSGREHRVPLSAAAMSVISHQKPDNVSYHSHPLVFGKLSNMALLMLLRRMDRGDLTAHGFRSTFRTWAADKSTFPADVCEAALAHKTGSKTELAYNRGELFDKRRKLMEAWSSYCGTTRKSGVLSFARPVQARA